ncbi:hypothetical protein FSP39_012959 [Pinctada imbricata]|uniref:Tyrosine-protein kinase n=1 Tax=Pinctada imbricata TaxID=66713 RepID=A0AA88Y092_PINIB|nr:hypothetical protein FSP39_012959 [Pinctada imbricata]
MGDGYEDDEQFDSVYANDEITDLIGLNVRDQLKQSGLSLIELLKRDKESCEGKDSDIAWYHHKIPRESAESLLKEGLRSLQGHSDGLFLIRDSTSSEKDFVVSVTHDAKVYHFQIKEVFDGHYKIDEGPTTQGLEKIVNYYQNGANGLITRLTKHCKGSAPPDRARVTGPTNILHKTVLQGTTCLHDAAKYGRTEIAKLLIEHEADVHIKDRAGFTPLHRACASNYPEVIEVLIKHGNADPQTRAPKTGWVALHEAAMHGYPDCIKKLLHFHAPMMPRADDNQTPLDLAKRYNRLDCIDFLQFPDRRDVRSKRSNWYHSGLDRKGANAVLENFRKEEGLFLVRKSTRNQNFNVLSLCHKKAVFNFEIKVMEYQDQLVHYIDDGPFFQSLEHLIDHYSRYADGLSAKLRASVNPGNDRIEIEEDYYNIASNVDNAHRKSAGPPPVPSNRPVLPPRPPEPEEDEDFYAAVDNDQSNAKPPPLPPSHPPKVAPSVKKQESHPPAPSLGERQTSFEEFKKISNKDIKLGGELGQGEFGAVKKAVYTIKRGFAKHTIDVAVKTFHEDGALAGALASIMEEARLMQRLDHVCIVKLYGICEQPFMLVEEFISKGSMLDNLIDHRKNIKVNPTLYLWAAQIASGMCYLEEQKIVHRDLAARNILVQNMDQVKISDFGLSRAYMEEKNYYQASKGGRWPIKWYAPECVNYGKFTHKTDVWSFGVTLYEMFSWGEQPYGDKKGIEVMQFIESGKRLSRPEDCPDTCYEMMLKCWAKEPEKRPTFGDLFEHFCADKEYASVKDISKLKTKRKR